MTSCATLHGQTLCKNLAFSSSRPIIALAEGIVIKLPAYASSTSNCQHLALAHTKEHIEF